LRAVLLIDGRGVFAADRQEPFDNDLLIGATGQSRVGYDGEGLADQRRQSKSFA
jgi:hypothetical protein